MDTTQYPDGARTIRARVRDNCETTSYDFVEVIIDNTAPALSVASHSNNQYVKGSITVSGTAADSLAGLEKVEFKIGNDEYAPTTGSADWEFAFDTTKVTDGSYTVYVKATDNALNIKESSFVLRVDNSGPTTGSITFTPMAGSSGTTFTISVDSISDGIGCGVKIVKAYVFDPNGLKIAIPITLDASGTGIWKGLLSRDRDDPQGNYTLEIIVAEDYLGNSKTKNLNLVVIYDRSNPTISITSHSNHDTISGITTLAGITNDAYSGLDYGEIHIDDQFYGTISIRDGLWSFDLTTTDLLDGYHHFKVVVYDNVGYSRSIIFLLAIENDGITVSLFIPVVDEYDNYITSCSVIVGNSQVVIALVIPETVSGAYARLMLAEPYLTMWTLNDITYVDGENTVSFKGLESGGPHYIQFPIAVGEEATGLGLCGRSVALSLDKTAIEWSLTSADYEIEQFEIHQITMTAKTGIGVPYGVPLDISVYALQENEIFLIGSGTLNHSGVAIVDILMGNNPELSPGSFSVFVRVIDTFEAIYDTTTSASALFSGFTFYEQCSWSFNPIDAEITHYTATVYD
ncbi:MAG: Ig-like domain-containing protein, partial [Candidatus Thorarchaeota archaeon]|nr:Ig-like domain-containing protein [Candidatus Thorarchaeota archaeon]